MSMSNSADVVPIYSYDGILAHHILEPGKKFICVESNDDITFWARMLARVKDLDQKVLEFIWVGGRPELEKFEDDLRGEKSPVADLFVIARDADYDEFDEGKKISPRVLHTYLHSIENVMICKCKVEEIVIRHARRDSVENDLVAQIFDEFNSRALDLAIVDAALRIGKFPIHLLGSCEEFLKDGDSFDLSKIDRKLSEICSKVELSDEVARIRKTKRKAVGFCRGHFVFSFFRIRISQTVRNMLGVRNFSLPKEILMSELLELCEKCNGEDSCKLKIENRVSKVLLGRQEGQGSLVRSFLTRLFQFVGFKKLVRGLV
jgi:hypothetical protein